MVFICEQGTTLHASRANTLIGGVCGLAHDSCPQPPPPRPNLPLSSPSPAPTRLHLA